MSELWLPGMSGPLEGLVAGVHLRIEAYAEEHGSPPRVDVDLREGGTVTVRTLSPEPGFGFVTLRPHAEDGDEEEWIVPIGAVLRVRLSPAEEQEPFGFTLPAR